jgi:hypothetical protein
LICALPLKTPKLYTSAHSYSFFSFSFNQPLQLCLFKSPKSEIEAD